MASDLSWNLSGNDDLSGVLEKLERTLDKMSRKLDGVTGNAKEMGRALGETERDANRAANSLDRMGDQADQTSSRLGRLADRAREVGNSAAQNLEGVGGHLLAIGTSALQMGAMVGTGIAVAVSALAGFALKAAASNETAAISFEVLLGSAKASHDFLKQLQAFAASTPFAMPELRDSASRLLAVGISADRIIPILTRLGDATSGMGTGAEGIARAVYAMQQVFSSGVAQMDDLNQLADAGIPIFDALAAHFKTSVGNLRKELVPKGKVTAADLFGAIEGGEGPAFERLKGMMARQSTTLAGIWSAFQDNVGQAMAKFAEPAVPAVKKVVDWMAINIPKGLDKLLDMGRQVKEIFKGSPMGEQFRTALTDLANNVMPKLGHVWSEFTRYLTENRDTIERLGRFITEAVIPLLGGTLVVAAQTTVGAFIVMVEASDKVVTAMSFMTRRILELSGFILAAGSAAFGWIPGVGPQLEAAEAKFNSFAGKVLTRLDEIDGKNVTVGITTVLTTVSGKHSSGGDITTGQTYKGRASGGPVWAGESYAINEYGTERFYAASTGVIQDANTTRSMMSGSGGGGVIGTLRVVHETPDGQVIREELLQLKRSRGLVSLGF